MAIKRSKKKGVKKKKKSLKLKNTMEFSLISAVSHEIRTPLSSIKGYASILEGGDLGGINQEQQSRLKKIIELCDYLASLTDSLLYASEIKFYGIRRDRELLHISEVVYDALSILKLPIEEKRIKLEVDLSSDLPEFWGERKGLEQVFINLINNAVKFTPSGGSITIKADLKENKYISVDIIDTGMGIPKANLFKIFKPFYRVDTQNRRGVGFGLSIVEGIIKLHKGTIRAYSAPGKGSRFNFTIPVDLRR